MFLWTDLVVGLTLIATTVGSNVAPVVRLLMFPTMDINGDGLIPFAEFRSFQGRNGDSTPSHVENAIRGLFNSMDTNVDGSLDMMEVSRRMEQRVQRFDDGVVRRMFDLADEDHNSVLSFSEFNKVSTINGFTTNEERVRNLFDYLDVTHDDGLTFQEFEDMFRFT